MENSINQESAVTTTFVDEEARAAEHARVVAYLNSITNVQTEEEKAKKGVEYLNSITTWESSMPTEEENEATQSEVVPSTTYVGIEKFEVTVSDLVEKYKNYFSEEVEPETSATMASSHRPTFDGFREQSESKNHFFASVSEDEFFDEYSTFEFSTELEGGDYKEKSLYSYDLTARFDFGSFNIRENSETKSLWGDYHEAEMESTLLVRVDFNNGDTYEAEFNKISTLHDSGENISESDVIERLTERFVQNDGFSTSEYKNNIVRTSSQMTEVMQNI